MVRPHRPDAFVPREERVIHLVPHGSVVRNRAQVEPETDIGERVIDREEHVLRPKRDFGLVSADVLALGWHASAQIALSHYLHSKTRFSTERSPGGDTGSVP